MGTFTSWKGKKYILFGVNWSYEAAMISKGYEVALEASLQTLIMTYVNMRTGWMSLNVFKDLTKAYMQGGGNEHLSDFVMVCFARNVSSVMVKIY